MEAFSANVRRLRKECGLTQERLAEEAGLHLTDIARIETLRRDPGIKVVAKIAHGLRVPASVLLEGIGSEFEDTPAEARISDARNT